MELSANQFNAILSELRAGASQPDSGEKRRATRVKQDATVAVTLCPQQGVWHLADDRVGHQETVTLRNISSRGVGILHHRPLLRGDQFVIEFHSPQCPSVQFLCTVAHCRRVTPHQYTIGAEFTCIVTEKTPSMDADEIKAAILG